MSDELKPCPWCGKQPVLYKNSAGFVVVECANLECQVVCSVTESTKPNAIAAWNTRKEAGEELWLEFLTPENLCGLCGQHGIIDTRPLGLRTNGGVPVSHQGYCICPNGRALNQRSQLKGKP